MIGVTYRVPARDTSGSVMKQDEWPSGKEWGFGDSVVTIWGEDKNVPLATYAREFVVKVEHAEEAKAADSE